MSLATSTPLQGGQSAPIPRLAEPLEDAQRNGNGDVTPRATATTDAADDNIDPKKKKRSLFGFGKKKTDDGSQATKSLQKDESSVPSAPSATPNANTSAPSGPPTRRTTASPINIEATHMLPPSSPGRNLSSSPRMTSPAGSQIFERDVTQESVLLPNSPAIPSHIKTEDMIPPALDATSEAITDSHLDPDSVEIITHTQHQTAASTLQPYGEPPMSASHLSGSSWADELANSFSERDFGLGVTDNASNYGSLENTADVRRLSFISFADVVQSEQGPPAGNHRDSIHLAGLTSLPSPSFPAGLSMSSLGNRSPSPIRSPVSSSAGGASPPTSKSGSVKGLEMSPPRKPLGSPMSAHHNIPSLGGELSVETMTQALRRTASGDLGTGRSMPTSPVEGPSR
ncbi:hypothetical protein CONLIGDRAFT_686588 [Coniochaeta ligniaria NRRL 30616]|uniref:Uncharacterized protein n=1 Tax=Coniochaeta ligniaria NRRL 30616 TaxID=1408157 RepID=A0A1J7I842_9PEZI|nr:hypothetical protein CONLIGDRAFT_686588 [Coniochaeta ligniaria NRRL 30616]